MKVVLTVFAPMLVAIAIRLALFLVGLVIGLPCYLLGIAESLVEFSDSIAMFDTFVLEESWGYWILVVIGSFLAEMAIWGDD